MDPIVSILPLSEQISLDDGTSFLLVLAPKLFSPCRQVASLVFTPNESPPSKPILFYHEIAQVPKSPEHLMFFCGLPSKTGGETSIAYLPIVYNRVSKALPEFLRKLEEQRVRYTRVLPDGDDPQAAIGRGWQSTYQTQDRKRSEQVCRKQGTDMYGSIMVV